MELGCTNENLAQVGQNPIQPSYVNEQGQHIQN